MIRVVAAVEGDLPRLAELEPSSEPGPPPGRADGPGDLVDAAAARLRRPDLVVEPVERRGRPATVVVDEARDLRADLVIVGSRGLGPVRTIFEGSVAGAVVDAAPCPVLVARRSRLRSVLLATDGSAASVLATELVARWPIFAGIPIHLLSVATGVPGYGELGAAGGMSEAVETRRHQKIADAAAMTLIEAGRAALPNVRTGDAAGRIVGFAEARGIDLIVVGSRGRSGLQRVLTGSVARAVLDTAQTSVLIVRAQTASRPAPTE